LLIALSLIAPYRGPADLPCPESAQTLALAAGSGAEDGGFGELPAGDVPAEYGGDTRSGDGQQHEMDRILSLFFPHWTAATARWGGFYSASLSPDPVFSFDRPPKTALRRAWAAGGAYRGTAVPLSLPVFFLFQPAAGPADRRIT
jgi:hypothetical protein